MVNERDVAVIADGVEGVSAEPGNAFRAMLTVQTYSYARRRQFVRGDERSQHPHVETRVVREQRTLREQGLHLEPHLAKVRGELRVLRAESVDARVPELVLVEWRLNQPRVTLGHAPVAHDAMPRAQALVGSRVAVSKSIATQVSGGATCGIRASRRD